MMWLVWLCASCFGVGFIAGGVFRILYEWRYFRSRQKAIRNQQEYIRKLKDERKSLLGQNRMGRGL